MACRALTLLNGAVFVLSCRSYGDVLSWFSTSTPGFFAACCSSDGVDMST